VVEFERVEVLSRDEYREAERPVSFMWRGKRFEIEEILDRWYEGHRDPTRMPLRYFRVRTKGGEVHVLRYHEFFAAWGILVS